VRLRLLDLSHADRVSNGRIDLPLAALIPNEKERVRELRFCCAIDLSPAGSFDSQRAILADEEKPVRFAKLSPTGRERLPPLRADRAPENAATNDSATHSRESCCTTVKAAAWRKGAETVSLRAASQLVDPHFCRVAAGSRSVDSQRRRSQSHAGLRPRCIHLQLLDCIARGARESKRSPRIADEGCALAISASHVHRDEWEEIFFS